MLVNARDTIKLYADRKLLSFGTEIHVVLGVIILIALFKVIEVLYQIKYAQLEEMEISIRRMHFSQKTIKTNFFSVRLE